LTDYLSATVLNQLADTPAETEIASANELDVDLADTAQLLSNLDQLSDQQVDLLLRQMQADQWGNP
jgi:hypothetical protein